jgi:hypothetical protein
MGVSGSSSQGVFTGFFRKGLPAIDPFSLAGFPPVTRPGQSFFLVGGIGLEPTAFAMSTQRSNQLS